MIKINKYHKDLPLTMAENKAAREYDPSSEHPTPEQLMLREAAKWLTPKQKKVWELYNYDKLTQDEIAKKLKVSQSMIAQHIKAIETRIAKWINSNLEAYKLLKADLGPKD